MTYSLSNEEAEVFNSAIENIPDYIPYVVLRNYHNLPDSVPGVDIDIFSPHPNNERIQEYFFNVGFQKGGRKQSSSDQVVKLMKEGINKPVSALKFAVNSPAQFISTFVSHREYQYHSGQEGYKMNKIRYKKLDVDVYNHLAHVSASNGKFYRLKPEVESQMINNRQKLEDFFTPHPIDELVHMICRGTFDHCGDFRDYYIERCNELYKKIDDKFRLKKLLRLVFYNAAEVVTECIEEGEYDQIKQRLKSYSNY